MKRDLHHDSHEHLLPSDAFHFDYGVDIDREIDELHVRHMLPALSDAGIDHDSIAFGATFVVMFCFIATLIITSVEAGLLV